MSGPAPYVRIRPGYVERGVLYARKAAYANGYATGRSGGPMPYARDVYPFREEWSTGYWAGRIAREEYDLEGQAPPRQVGRKCRRKTASDPRDPRGTGDAAAPRVALVRGPDESSVARPEGVSSHRADGRVIESRVEVQICLFELG